MHYLSLKNKNSEKSDYSEWINEWMDGLIK